MKKRRRKKKRPLAPNDLVVFRLTPYSMVKVGVLTERTDHGWGVIDQADGRRYLLADGDAKIRRPEKGEDMDRYLSHIHTKRSQGRLGVLPDRYASKDVGTAILDADEAEYAKYRKAVSISEEDDGAAERLIKLDHPKKSTGMGERAAKAIESGVRRERRKRGTKQ